MNLNKFWKKRSVNITEYDPTYKVVYLGNVLTSWAKGEGCVDKPLATLWKNYCQSVKPDVYMKVTICNSGLKAVTKEHGLTEYWSNRITYCAAHFQYPKVFCWVYRHEGKKLRQELRCHAVLCSKEETSRRMASQLQLKLALALQEFKREKICRQNARLSLANSVYDNPSLPRRKILLSTGSMNYRPPLERSKSAPKLMVIEEVGEIGELLEECAAEVDQQEAAALELQQREERYQRQFSQLLQQRLLLHQRRQRKQRLPSDASRPEEEDEDDDDDEDGDVERGHHDEDDDDDDHFSHVTTLDNVSILMSPSPDCDQEDATSDILYPDDECDDRLLSDRYNTDALVTSTMLAARRMRVIDDVDDDLTCTPPSTSSSSSSPSSGRDGLKGQHKNEEDNVSDESGYSEEHGFRHRDRKSYSCNV